MQIDLLPLGRLTQTIPLWSIAVFALSLWIIRGSVVYQEPSPEAEVAAPPRDYAGGMPTWCAIDGGRVEVDATFAKRAT